MQRRSLLKTAGGIGAATTAGGLGLFALTGSAAAAELTPSDPVSATTDDGQLKYVAYGGVLRFEWNGLDTEATHGEYEVETRVSRPDGGWTSWVTHGKQSGQLGDEGGAEGHDGDGAFEHDEGNSSDSWGGANDTNSGPGTDGFWEFQFGSEYGQKDYAIAYDDEGDLGNSAIAVPNQWETSRFASNTDGESRTTLVEVRKTCRVYDGDPTAGSTMLIEDDAKGRLEVTINNHPKTGTASGGLNGTVGADES